MTKIVYNACHGGFGLSEQAVRRYAEIKGLTLYVEEEHGLPTYWTVPASERPTEPKLWHAASLKERQAFNRAYEACVITPRDIPRTDPALVQAVEELGKAANSRFSELKIEDVPRGTAYRIDEYDGSERVMTNSDYDWNIA